WRLPCCSSPRTRQSSLPASASPWTAGGVSNDEASREHVEGGRRPHRSRRRVGRAVGWHHPAAERDARESGARARLALSDVLRRGRESPDEHPRVRRRVPRDADHRRHLRRERQGPVASRLEQAAVAVSGESGDGRLPARVDRPRRLHAPARRPRRLEHDAEGRQVGRHLPQREVPDRRHRMGLLLPRGGFVPEGSGRRFRPSRDRRRHVGARRRPLPGNRRGLARVRARAHTGTFRGSDLVAGRGRSYLRGRHASPDSGPLSRMGQSVRQRRLDGQEDATRVLRALCRLGGPRLRHALRHAVGRPDLEEGRRVPLRPGVIPTEARMAHTVFHTCSLCEATCGLKFEVEDNRIVSVRGDDDDVFSRGYVCPKGIAIADVHHDPDRLRRPVRRNAAGDFEEISWDEALDLVAGRLGEIRAQHGSNAIGFYWGNPTGNNHGALLMLSSFTKALGTRNRFSAGSQDANPRLVTSYELYGSSISIPIPDIDRTDYFLCLGGNPMISNGSVMTAPDMRRRLRAVRERGGKVVVVDPRRTETAKEADEHVAIRPGGDGAFLLAMAQVLVERGRLDRRFIESTTNGWPEIERRLTAFTPARVAAFAGVPADVIERLALEFADARSAVCYSRVGVCVGAYATVATFATDRLNIVAVRLGRECGPMLTTPAFDIGRVARMSGLDG